MQLNNSTSTANFNINAANTAANNISSNNSIEEYYTSDVEDYNAQFQEYIPAEPNSDIESSPEPITPAGNWLELINHPDYEIYSEYPHDIRKKDTGRVVSKSINKSTGYWMINLNRKPYKLHRLIAKQFVPNPNPDEFNVVDHVNRDRTDYHINNLRWTTQSKNCKNKSSHLGVVYRYVDEIAEDSIVVNRYGNRTLEHYYYDENLEQFYWNDIELNRYREIPVITRKDGSRYIQAIDTNGKRVQICLKKFKSMYNLE